MMESLVKGMLRTRTRIRTRTAPACFRKSKRPATRLSLAVCFQVTMAHHTCRSECAALVSIFPAISQTMETSTTIPTTKPTLVFYTGVALYGDKYSKGLSIGHKSLMNSIIVYESASVFVFQSLMLMVGPNSTLKGGKCFAVDC